jgi:hypothetical protein
MAIVNKSSVSMSSAQSIAAATAAPAPGAGIISTNTVTNGFGLGISGIITNGATGPTITVTVQVVGSVDSGTNYYMIDQVQGLTGNSVVTQFAFNYIPDGWPLIALRMGGNTGQAVTVTAVAAYGTSIT